MPEVSPVAQPGAPRVALIDANVLFAPRLRDLMIHLHMARIINVHWTREIEDEWTRNVVEKGNADPGTIRQCLCGMRQAVMGWEVADYQGHAGRFEAVHPKDRHVAAAAFKLATEDWPGQPVALVTRNLKDFPSKAFSATPIRRLAPGPYLDLLYSEEPTAVLAVVDACRQKLKRPPADQERYVGILMSHQCRDLAHALAKVWQVACPKVARNGSLFYAANDARTAA